MSSQSSINPFIVFLLVFSVVVNVMFLSGCAELHNVIYGSPCKFSSAHTQPSANDGSREGLDTIARYLGVETSGKTSSDLVGDIQDKLSQDDFIPSVLTDTELEEICDLLSRSEADKVKGFQNFVSSLQGKRVIVIGLEN